MRVDFNEISKLRDSKLILETFSAVINQLSSQDEKRKTYFQIYNYCKHSKLNVSFDFFIKYAQILFEENDYDQLKDLAQFCPNNEIHKIFIDLGIAFGKIQDVVDLEINYLHLIQPKGLNRQVIDIVNKLELLIGSRASLAFIKLKALLSIGDEKTLSTFLKEFREENLVKSSGFLNENPSKKKAFIEIYNEILIFSYKTKDFYQEQCRWVLLKDIIEQDKNSKNVKKALDLFILTNSIYDYSLLTAYFSMINRDLGGYFKIFIKNQKEFSILEIIKNQPLFLTYFKDHVGSYILNNHQNNEIYKKRSLENHKKIQKGFDHFIYQLGISQSEMDYAKKIEDCFFDWVQEDSVEIKQLNFYDLLILLKDLRFTDAMEKIFWIANEKKLISEKERYLVGKALMEANKLSRAHNVLAYCESSEGMDLYKRVCHLKGREQDV